MQMDSYFVLAFIIFLILFSYMMMEPNRPLPCYKNKTIIKEYDEKYYEKPYIYETTYVDNSSYYSPPPLVEAPDYYTQQYEILERNIY